MEITLQTASSVNTRQPGVVLKSLNSPENKTFKTEVEARIDVPDLQKIQNQRSEVALPDVSTINTSVTYLHKNNSPINSKERIVPIQVCNSLKTYAIADNVLTILCFRWTLHMKVQSR